MQKYDRVTSLPSTLDYLTSIGSHGRLWSLWKLGLLACVWANLQIFGKKKFSWRCNIIFIHIIWERFTNSLEFVPLGINRSASPKSPWYQLTCFVSCLQNRLFFWFWTLPCVDMQQLNIIIYNKFIFKCSAGNMSDIRYCIWKILLFFLITYFKCIVCK